MDFPPSSTPITLTLRTGLEISSVLVIISPRLLYEVNARVMLESAPAMDDWSGNSTLSSSDCQTLLWATWLLLSSCFFITAIEMSSNWISIVEPTSTVAARPFEISLVMFKMLVAIFTSSSFFFISASSIFLMSSLVLGST